jgi:hypothetical protein
MLTEPEFIKKSFEAIDLKEQLGESIDRDMTLYPLLLARAHQTTQLVSGPIERRLILDSGLEPGGGKHGDSYDPNNIGKRYEFKHSCLTERRRNFNFVQTRSWENIAGIKLFGFDCADYKNINVYVFGMTQNQLKKEEDRMGQRAHQRGQEKALRPDITSDNFARWLKRYVDKKSALSVASCIPKKYRNRFNFYGVD